MPTAILEIKLGRPYEMPQKRLNKLLEQARRDCCTARNAGITHWLLWRRSHPDWQPGSEYEAPARKIKASGPRDRKASKAYKKLLAALAGEKDAKKREKLQQRIAAYDGPPPPPKDPPYAPREFMSRELYNVATAAVPDLNTSITSSCVQE